MRATIVCSLFVSILVASAAPTTLVLASALPDPTAAKAADKCQKGIAKAGATFTTKTLKSLEKCYDALFKCIQTKPGDQKCLDKALTKCAKEVDTKAPKERAKLASSILKKCGSFADLTSVDGLDYDTLAATCENDYGITLTDVASVAECVRAQHECHAETMFSYEMARAGQIANALAVPLRAGTCLEDLGGMGNVGDPKGLGKALDKCQKQLKKAGAKFVASKLKSLRKCVTTIFGCVQKKPGDLKCTAKAQKTCDKEIGDKIPKAEAKLVSALDKRCLDIFADLGVGSAMNTDALGVPCLAFGVAGLATLENLAQCVMRQHECLVEELFGFEAPRADALLQTVGRSLRSDFCPTATPTPTPTATPTVTPTTTPTPTSTVTPAPTTTLTPGPGQVLLAVTRVGAGTGTVTLQPSGNICGTTCAVSVVPGTLVTLQAATVNGDDTYFQGFDHADCSGAQRDCSITVNVDTLVDATFSAQTFNPTFVSSISYDPTLGGTAPYDQKCNDLATAAGINNLPGDAFVAWMSDSSSHATTRLGAARGFVRLDGLPFADTVASLSAGALLNPLSLDENAVPRFNLFSMTGTAVDGTASGFDCSDWTDSGSTYTEGVTSTGPRLWTNTTSSNCTVANRIYCLGTTKNAVLSPTPASGKLIYMTNQPYLPGNDPDAQCTADKPAGAGTVVALLSRTTQTASALLGVGTTYVRPDGQIVGTGQELIDTPAFTALLKNGIWQTGDGTYGSFLVWSGASDLTTIPLANRTCDDWSADTSSGRRNASSAHTGSAYWAAANSSCTITTIRLYCVEQ